MDRNENALAIVINSDRVRNVDRLVTLLSPVWGIIKVMVYGAQKSKKGAKAPLYTEGSFNLYHVREKDQYSLVDLTPISVHEKIGESFSASASAAFLSECVLLYKDTDYTSIFSLYTTALDFLEDDIYYHKRVLTQFLLRYLSLSGYLPSFTECPICSHVYDEKEVIGFSLENLFPCCSNCDTMAMHFVLPPNARAYLNDSLKTSFAKAVNFEVSQVQIGRILRYLIKLCEYCFSFQFKSTATLDLT